MVMKLTEREKAMNSNLRFIIFKSLPIGFVEDREVRAFSQHDAAFCHDTFKKVLFLIVELVERKISDEMKQTRGALMHDAWSHNGVHYVGLFASYCRKVKVLVNGNLVEEEVPVAPLIAVSPMGEASEATNDSGTTATSEVTRFTAEAYVRFFEDIMHDVYKIDVHEWTTCLIADNCSVNKLIAKLMEIPNVGCASHKLHLEVRRMIEKDRTLSTTIESVHNVMRNCRMRLKNRAILRNLCNLSPVMNNATRWSTTYLMLQRFNRIRSALIATADAEDADLVIDRRSAFKNRVAKFADQLGEINTVTVELQKRGLTLSDARMALDELLDGIDSLQSIPESALFQCQLGDCYISPTSQIGQDASFESGVVKIQRGETNSMSDVEKERCKGLLQRRTEQDTEIDVHEPMSMADRLKKRKKNSGSAGSKEYINTQFILGSVAEVERLWSMAKYILLDHRKGTSPIVFEAMLFLKINRSYWDEQTVKQAMSMVANQRVESAIEEDEDYMQLGELA